MIKTHSMLIEEQSKYAAPANKLIRMVRDGQIIPIVRGLYETDRTASPHLLAGSIYGPSYLSFEFALSCHGLIPERVATITSATFSKKKKKEYSTPFGRFTYRDVPPAAFPLGIETREADGYHYRIACPEKALCDQLYKLPPVAGTKELEYLLFDDLRIDRGEFAKLNAAEIHSYEGKYRCTNVKLLDKSLRRVRP
ncbi:MAG: hypothetical protein RR218_01410 [Gordonibacter sp.]